MKKLKTIAILIICSCSMIFAANPTDENKMAVERYAIYIASNNGGDKREVLRYAGTDAKRLSSAMMEIGGVKAENSIILEDPSKEAVDATLAQLAKKINEEKNTAKRTEFIFYYSGHSDESALLLGNENYGYSELKSAISDVPTDVHVVMLDSCFSGNFIRAKGGSRQKSFLVDDSSIVQGHAYLSSSSESESSQESDIIQSSYFTHALVTGLRGAADSSGDNKVSLNELYYYAFNETLSQTEKSTIGPQHPSFNITLVGSGDLVLTDISSAESVLLLGSESAGKYYIRDKSGILVSEVNKIAGNQLALALDEGVYSVVVITPVKTMQTIVQIGKGKQVDLSVAKFVPVSTVSGRARGGEIEEAVQTNQTEPVSESGLDPELEAIKQDALDAVRGMRKTPQENPSQSEESDELTEAQNEAFSLRDRNAPTGTNSKENSIQNQEAYTPELVTKAKKTADKTFFSEYRSFFTDSNFFPVQVAFTSKLVFPKEELNTFLSLGVISVNANSVLGIQGSGIAANNESWLFGVQSAGISVTSKKITGLQSAGIVCVSDIVNGMQSAGIVNKTNILRGVQAAGIVNVAHEFAGVQTAGIVNVSSGSAKGVQCSGIINVAKEITGLQIGLINVADSNKGVSIGLFNFIKDGICSTSCYWDTDDLFGVQYQGGTNFFYTTFNVAFPTYEEDLTLIDYFQAGMGLGFRIPMGQSFSVDCEYITNTVNPLYIEKIEGLAFVKPEFRATVNLSFAKHFSIFASASVDVCVPEYNSKAFEYGKHEAPVDISGDGSCLLYPHYSFGIKF